MSVGKNNFIEGVKNVVGDAYFKSLAETIPHILLVIDPETYRIQYINHLQPGYTLENVIGREMFDFVQPEHRAIYIEKLAEAMCKRTTVILESEGQNSQSPHLKAWYRTHISVLPNTENGIASVMLLAEDITEAKLKEIEKINKEEKLKAIINNTDDIICSIDRNYNLMEFNSVFTEIVYKGFNVELLPGMPVLSFVDPAQHGHLKNIYKRVENGETCYDVQKFKTVSGDYVYNETNYHPILNINKEVIGISVFSKDITERIKAETKIKSALREKEVLLAEIHHRIKNNLAVVSSLLQLQEMNISNKEAQEALSSSRKRIKSTALIHELLYKNESFEYIDLNEYITELFQNLRINDNVQLILNGDGAKTELNTAMPLGLMLNEIIMNSFKHSYKDGAEGKTEIVTKLLNGNLIIDYCDCKGSFPEEVDFKNSTTTGLTLIHTFANQLNGTIQLVNNTPPKYKIIIPLNDGQ